MPLNTFAIEPYDLWEDGLAEALSLTYNCESLSGVLVMGIGSITFSLPHFLGGEYMVHDGSSASGAPGDDNICRAPKISHQSSANDLLDKLPGLDKIKSLTEGKERHEVLEKLAVGKS